MTALLLPGAETPMMNLVLEHGSSPFASYFIVRPVAQAGGHAAKALPMPEKMRLIPQPAYRPELNPTEQVWEERREKHLPNLVLPSLDDGLDKVGEGLNQREAEPERLRSLTYFPHFRTVS